MNLGAVDYTFKLPTSQFALEKGRGNIVQRPPSGPYYLRRMWRQAAKIRGLLDNSRSLMTEKSTRVQWLRNPRTARFSGWEGSMVLMEQSIVATVSSWEFFLRETVRYVLNDSDFVKDLVVRSEMPLVRMAHRFGLRDTLPSDSETLAAEGMVNIGDLVCGSRKIRWQDLRTCNKLLRTLFPDLRLPELSRYWSQLVGLFKARHLIVHRSGVSTKVVDEYDVEDKGQITGPYKVDKLFEVVEAYTPDQIEALLQELLNVAEGVHNRLFSTHQTNLGI